MIYALSSNDETINHLETLFETESLKSAELYNSLIEQLNLLGKKLNVFIQSLQKYHMSEK